MPKFPIRKQPPTDQELDQDLAEVFQLSPPPVKQTAILVAGYTRVSSAMQLEEGNSLEDQEKRIQEYIERYIDERGWEVVGIFSDPARSGRNDKRPALRRLKRAIRAGEVDVVVVDRIDRLSRNLLSLMQMIKFLNDHHVRLVSLRENIDFSTHWGRLVLYVLGALAEFYASALSEEIRLARRRRAEDGYLTGAFRYGYCKGNCSSCTDPNGPGYCPYFGGPDLGHGKVRIPHPVESVATQLMFEWYATGRYSDNDIAQRLNKEVFTLLDGTEVRFRTKGRPGICPPQEFDKDAVRAILNNPIYTGYVTYAGSDPNGRKRRKPVDFFKGKHQAIVSLNLFRQVQNIRRNRYHRTTSLHNPTRAYPLSGILFCAVRHSPLRGISSGGNRYYVDRLCQQQLPRKQWHQKNLRAEVIEGQVQDLVTRIVLPQAWREWILAYLIYDEGTDEIEREKFAIRQRLERAMELYQSGDWTREKFERAKAKCRHDLAALIPARTSVGEEAAVLLDNLPALWEALTAEEQKTLYRLIFSAIYVQDETIVEIEPRGPFRSLLAEAAARAEE